MSDYAAFALEIVESQRESVNSKGLLNGQLLRSLTDDFIATSHASAFPWKVA